MTKFINGGGSGEIETKEENGKECNGPPERKEPGMVHVKNEHVLQEGG